MQSELPWSTCENASHFCKQGVLTTQDIDNFMVGPLEDYFSQSVLGWDKTKHDWENFGEIKWQLVLCLLGA